ncbi:hypothetical protein D1871_16515 [Nakamurella silvestris]|nr:hypothetical protein D1871_16515 [Nakamurella silvestris]
MSEPMVVTAPHREDAVRGLRPYLGPAPVSEPPYDDDPGGPGAPLVRVAPTRRVVPLRVTAESVPGWSHEEDIGVCRTPVHQLQPVERTAQMLTRAMVEVLGGLRPVEQLRIHCAADVFAGIRLRQLNPLGGHPRVGTIRVAEPTDGVAEVNAVIRVGHRARAIAFRLQGLDGRWRITDLQLG